MSAAEPPLQAWAPVGAPEVTAGTDLVALIEDLLGGVGVRSGDVVAITSKVVAKAEGRQVPGEREDHLDAETVRVVARRGTTRIVENRQGLVLAAAGLDTSNVPVGQVALLPADPDASARALRDGLRARLGVNVAVVVTDTAGRPWRTGQTDIAIGLAGMDPVDEHIGRYDDFGNPLVVTAPAIADEVAGLAELASGKLGGRPVVLVRGLEPRVLVPGTHGPGARAMQRPRQQDLFALGSREAVVAALAGEEVDCFGAPAAPEEVVTVLARLGLAVRATASGVVIDEVLDSATALHLRVLMHAHSWSREDESGRRWRPAPA